MLKIGLTGGIGSGKSTLGRIFQQMGYRVYNADDRARALMTTDEKIIVGVKKLFGGEAYLEDGSLNRKLIGGIVFQDKSMLEKLNQLVHPRTFLDFENWVNSLPADYDKSFVLKEAAILFESGAYMAVDKVITVYAPKSVRIQRVMARDQVSEAAVLARMDKQWPDSKKMQLADYQVFSDGKHSLIKQVFSVIRSLEAGGRLEETVIN